MKGQTLIETVLVGSIIAIIVSGISVLIVSSLSNAGFAKNQSLATQHSQDGLEVLRSIRNSNYAVFAGYNNTYCLEKDAKTLDTATDCSSPNIDNVFIRTVLIEPNSCETNVSRATITVTWTDGKCSNGTFCHKSQLASCLSTINPIKGIE